MLITFAPWSAAQRMPSATLAAVPAPLASSTLIGMTGRSSTPRRRPGRCSRGPRSPRRPWCRGRTGRRCSRTSRRSPRRAQARLAGPAETDRRRCPRRRRRPGATHRSSAPRLRAPRSGGGPIAADQSGSFGSDGQRSGGRPRGRGLRRCLRPDHAGPRRRGVNSDVAQSTRESQRRPVLAPVCVSALDRLLVRRATLRIGNRRPGAGSPHRRRPGVCTGGPGTERCDDGHADDRSEGTDTPHEGSIGNSPSSLEGL